MSHSQSLQSQMTEFEANAEPLQEWLNSTEVRVQESSARLHDLSAKKQELSKLQVLWSRRNLGPKFFLFGAQSSCFFLIRSPFNPVKRQKHKYILLLMILSFVFSSIIPCSPLTNNMPNCKCAATIHRSALPFES